MECGFFKKEKKTDLRAKRPGFFSSSHFGNWNNGQHFRALVSPSVSGVIGHGFYIAFPFQCSMIDVSLFEEEPI